MVRCSGRFHRNEITPWMRLLLQCRDVGCLLALCAVRYVSTDLGRCTSVAELCSKNCTKLVVAQEVGGQKLADSNAHSVCLKIKVSE